MSENTNDETFTLGGNGGDANNYSLGSLTGNLVAGHNYQLYFNVYNQAYPDGDDGTTATGYVNLTIGEVPTPSSFAALIGMGLMGLVAVRRRRRKAA